MRFHLVIAVGACFLASIADAYVNVRNKTDSPIKARIRMYDGVLTHYNGKWHKIKKHSSMKIYSGAGTSDYWDIDGITVKSGDEKKSKEWSPRGKSSWGIPQFAGTVTVTRDATGKLQIKYSTSKD